jgi:hypothetical protein
MAPMTDWSSIAARLLAIAGLGLAALGVGGGPALADEPRFIAWLADGAEIAGAEAAPWSAEGDQPSVDGRPLFDPANPAVVLVDRSLPAADLPPAYVEFWLGDRLPGRVTRYAAEGPRARETVPPHVVVAPDAVVVSRDPAPSAEVRAATRWVRRIVWAPAAGPRFAPGTAFLRDGRRVRFDGCTWLAEGVRLGLGGESFDVPFAELAELHLPLTHPVAGDWEAYYELVAVLCPDGRSRIARLECVDGLVATTSTGRYLPQTRGAPQSRRTGGT